MSLDVSLILYEEDKCENCGHSVHGKGEEVYSANITHKLVPMAEHAGIYLPVWRPDEFGITQAKHIIDILTMSIKYMRTNREEYILFNPENGWGSYDSFLPWLERYLEACKKYPEAVIEVSR